MESSLSFSGRQVAVTGGCSGIGLAVTRTLLALGAKVYVADICSEAPEELKTEDKCEVTLRCDVKKRENAQAFLNSIPGRLDGLVNSAGVGTWEGNIGTDEIFQRTMDINVTGTWNMATEALRRMSTQENIEAPGVVPGSVRSVGQGSIVNVGSGASRRPVPGMAAYTASKHAVLGLTRTWARDFPKLRVNLVAPGATDTPLAKFIAAGAPEGNPTAAVLKGETTSIPKGRLAYATDIADTVVFLLSDWSSFMTGQCLPVNGGNS